ncbi:MAG: SH3 domain-containing protein [Deltaproteobacteria bacterium]|nr:SH3 domain-containing protein [Deltaproteobacteria bacterium]
MIILTMVEWLFAIIDYNPALSYDSASPVFSSSYLAARPLAQKRPEEFLKVDTITGIGRTGSLICALGLVICLMGCQPRVNKAPPLPPPLPPAAAAPIAPPVRPTFYVNINQLSLRTCPGTDCQRITTLELNAEVENMGETKNWTQVKVKKSGTIGYVSSRYLSPNPVQVARLARKKVKKTKPRKATPPHMAAKEEDEDGLENQEPAPPLPKAM